MELLHSAVEDLGEIQVSFLIDRNRVRTVELSGLPARASPAIQIMSIEVVLDDAIRSAIRDPQVLIGRDDVRVRL